MKLLKKFNTWFTWDKVLFCVSCFLLVKILFAVIFHTESIPICFWELFFYISGVISGVGLAFSLGKR